MAKVEKVARAIYGAAFEPSNEAEAKRQKPSPGWCWERCGEQQREFATRQAHAAIAAYEEALEEEGMVVVPREPTNAMQIAVLDEFNDATVRDAKASAWDWQRAYKAALAAAPSPKDTDTEGAG
jgi:hypothetical protein